MLAGSAAQLDGLDEWHAQDAFVKGNSGRHVTADQGQVIDTPDLEPAALLLPVADHGSRP